MAASLPGGPLRLNDAAAVSIARPDVLVGADDSAASMLAELAATYYGFWNNGSTSLFAATVSPATQAAPCPLVGGKARQVWLMRGRPSSWLSLMVE